MNNDRITTFLVCPVCNKGKVFSFSLAALVVLLLTAKRKKEQE